MLEQLLLPCAIGGAGVGLVAGALFGRSPRALALCVGSLLVYLIAWFAYVLSLADEPLKLGPVLFLVFGFGPGIVLLAGVPFAIMAFASSRLTRRFTIQKR